MVRKGNTHEGPRLDWVEARCVSFGGSVPYLLWIELLQKILGVGPNDSVSGVRDTLRQTVEAFCPDTVDDVFPHLARLMSLPLEEEIEARLRRLGGQGLKYASSRALQTFVNALTSQRGPMVIVGEDFRLSQP